MPTGPIFISHASKDDAFVKELRERLEGQGLPVWVDSRNLRGGDKLAPEIDAAIEQARQVIVILSPNTINSPWVRKEINKALQVEQQHQAEGYRVIPLLLPGVEPSALELWFDEEPVGVPVELKTGGVGEALPALLAALGERLPEDRQPPRAVKSKPVAELLLELRDPTLHVSEGKRRVTATATLVYDPPQAGEEKVTSRRFTLTAPLGPIELDEIRWYLEEYYRWPVGLFKQRAERTETNLPEWGQALYRAALQAAVAQEAVTAWRSAVDGVARRVSVWVERELPQGASEEAQQRANQAASDLLALPWELLHDGRSYLFRGRHPVRVRRRLPNRYPKPVPVTQLPIRILLVSPRPEDEQAAYIDHRASALPLVQAVEHLGELVELAVLSPPTFPALRQALKRAAEAGQPFDVIHFDGHGVYSREHGLGTLCFEAGDQGQKLTGRATALVDADELAGLVRDYRLPLVFLEACQTATTENDPTASVAARLLEEGVTSIVAMSHSVLVETARRFVEPFYQALAEGARVGQAMLAGQQALLDETKRGQIMGAGQLHLQDWFVPVLYQEAQDPQLFTELPAKDVQQLKARERRLSFGDLPPTPPHTFIGRSRELLALERLLAGQPYAVLRGTGGSGKTTLAVELARWLVRTGRFRRAAFASVEQIDDARAVLDSLGQQLLPGGEGSQTWEVSETSQVSAEYSVAQYSNLKQALQPVERALRDQPTLIVLDNLESILPGPGQPDAAAAPLAELLELCQKLLQADPATRLLFTSREALPRPFDQAGRTVTLGALSQKDAVELVGRVMANAGLVPEASDPGQTPEEITALVEAVNRHARALVLLAGDLARRGVRATTENLRHLMAELDKQHPGQRENSLYASVELSLRRLPAELRAQVPGLGVFQGGAQLDIMAHVLEVDVDTARNLGIALIEVGLAEDMGYGHLRLDPALPPYLWGRLDQAEQARLRQRWSAGMGQLVNYLYEQHFKNAELAARLTLLELPNLLALLDRLAGQAPPEEVVGLASQLETLLEYLGRPKALARVVEVRKAAAEKLGDWSHASFQSEDKKFDRLLDSGDLQGAYTVAQQLLQRCLAAGEEAYRGATYDTAMAFFNLGRVLRRGGNAEAALTPLAEARRRFEILAEASDASAARMASVAITESGDCLLDLGRLEEAAVAYEEGIKRAEELDDQRGVAVKKGQLGTVRMLQQRYDEALAIYSEARRIFEELGEPGSVAVLWHQTGVVHRQAGQFDQAERAYRQSLAIKVQRQDRAGQATTLTQLGLLYEAVNRLEEAVTFHRQAADIDVKLDDKFNEGKDRNNLAGVLIKLQRYDEARRELARAIECKQPYGHAATPWNAWELLRQVEEATGDAQAAAQARQQALDSYLAYRRAGGENRNPGAQLAALVAQAIQQGETSEAEQILARYLGPDAQPWAKAMIPKLQAILAGARDPSLADDPDLDYDDAAELRLLLERVGD